LHAPTRLKPEQTIHPRQPQLMIVQNDHGALQVKFAASFVLPTPLYAATCG
jgi:hypothetical protein